MSSENPRSPEPADLDRLNARLAMIHLGEVESIVLIEVLIQSLEGTARPCWKEIAERYGFQQAHVSRAKASLVASNRIIEHDGAFFVDLDPAVWFPKTDRGQAKRDTAKRMHDIKAKHLPGLVSADASKLPNQVSRATDLPTVVTPDLPDLVSQAIDLPNQVSRSPNRNAPAPARGIEFNSDRQTDSLSNSRETEEDRKIASEVRKLAEEHWNAEVTTWAMDHWPLYVPEAFKAALVMSARQQKRNIERGGTPFDSPSGYIHTLAKRFEDDGVPPGTFAPPKKRPSWMEPDWQPPVQVFTPEEEEARLKGLAELRARIGLDKIKPAPPLRVAQ